MHKLNDKVSKMASTNINSEEFIAEVTDPNLEYKLVGTIVLADDLTEEDFQTQLDAIFAKIWQD